MLLVCAIYPLTSNCKISYCTRMCVPNGSKRYTCSFFILNLKKSKILKIFTIDNYNIPITILKIYYVSIESSLKNNVENNLFLLQFIIIQWLNLEITFIQLNMKIPFSNFLIKACNKIFKKLYVLIYSIFLLKKIT